uniref:Complex I assembly factor TIMMDC1, mitochondrial n=1 Tax=Setaria digitata TaxID=48799 RepID=A0A915PMV5_9BILA
MSDVESGALWWKFVSASHELFKSFLPKSDAKETVTESEPIPVSSSRLYTGGWHRLKELYTDGEIHFETGILAPCMKWAFIGTAFLTAPLKWQSAAERYDRYSKGRIFLNPHDALVNKLSILIDSVKLMIQATFVMTRRKWDYAFASFLRAGAINGTLAALYVGCMIAAVTHVAAWRDHFSLWSIPVITTSVSSIIACPFGLQKVVKGGAVGLTSGFALSVVLYSTSYFSNQTVDEIYREFKRQHELTLQAKRDEDRNLTVYQKEHKIWLRGLAKLQMERDEKLKNKTEDLSNSKTG